MDNNEKINWEEIFNLYNTIKWLYALCEETDPELKTNLQPLNEFRASLDHVMRIVAIENLEEYREKDAIDESKKLKSHLRRAFFDVCDHVTINYRNKIINVLQDYSVDEIKEALPNYYSEIRPRLEQFSEEIALLRTERRFNSSQEEEDAITKYPDVVRELQGYYKTVMGAVPSLIEIRQKNDKQNEKKRKNDLFVQWIIPIGAVVIGAILAIVGWVI